MSDAEHELAEFVGSFALDPLGFVMAIFPWGEEGTELARHRGPRKWQRETLLELGERLRAGYAPDAALMPVLKAIASGHGIGKSALVAWVIWWALSTCMDTKVVITANTEPQLRTKSWPEISKWARLALNSHWFDVLGLSIQSANERHARTWRCDAVTWSETNLEAFAGLHNEGKRLLLVFDEASGIAARVWEVAKGALTDANTEIIWLVLGNPTQPGGAFYACFAADRAMWFGRHIDARTVEGTNKVLFEQWMAAYGEDSDFYRVRVRGVFPRAGEQQFISPEVVEAAAKRDAGALLTDPLVLGVDVARSPTGDESVIAVRKGRDARSWPWFHGRGIDTMQLAGRVADMADELAADAIFVDAGGVGGGVVDRLRQLGYAVIEVQFGADPDRIPVAGEVHHYANKRTEIWGHMREWLKTGAIPASPELASELAAPLFGYTVKNGRDVIQLERKQDMKKRQEPSPDRADALACTFAFPVSRQRVPAGAGHRRIGGMATTEYDPYG